MTDVTRILCAIEQGDPLAAGRLLPLVYDELRKLATAKMAQENPGQTLQATALVHEAYLRLVGVEEVRKWESRGHFFAAAAESMRRILIDQARKKSRKKRGGDRLRIDLDALDIAASASPQGLLAIDEAVDALAKVDPAAAEVVQLRYFAGLSIEQTSDALGISARTAYRHWSYARAWLHGELLNGDQ